MKDSITTIIGNTIRNVIIRSVNVKTHNKMLPYKKTTGVLPAAYYIIHKPKGAPYDKTPSL